MVRFGFGLGFGTQRQRGISDGRRRHLRGIHPDLVEESAGLSLEWTNWDDLRGLELDRFVARSNRAFHATKLIISIHFTPTTENLAGIVGDLGRTRLYLL
jgi:hypothetical protein